MKENLKPIRTTERARELGKKGGQSKSPRKVLASRINGLMKKKDITKQQRFYLGCLKEGNIKELVDGLLAEILLEAETFEHKMKVLSIVGRLIDIMDLKVDDNVGPVQMIFEGIRNNYTKDWL